MGIYLLWTLSIFGNLPRSELAPIAAADDSVNVLTTKLGAILHSSQLGNIISAFALGAVVSSFIGVGVLLLLVSYYAPAPKKDAEE